MYTRFYLIKGNICKKKRAKSKPTKASLILIVLSVIRNTSSNENSSNTDSSNNDDNNNNNSNCNTKIKFEKWPSLMAFIVLLGFTEASRRR